MANDLSKDLRGLYRWPAEWEPHAATWISWPHNVNSWPGAFEPIPEVFAEFIRTVAQFEPVHILASGEKRLQAEALIGTHPHLHLHEIPTDDCWIRDYGPWFLKPVDAQQPHKAISWEYNAWGEKYEHFANDNQAGKTILNQLGFESIRPERVMEGGSVETNGMGTLMTTRQCLLNPNRNPLDTEESLTDLLCRMTGAEHVIWLGDVQQETIAGDDTDAHIDQLARFVNHETVVIAAQHDSSDINFELLLSLKQQLQQQQLADGSSVHIVELPLPSPVSFDGQRLPASYANFYIGNGFVIVPTFDVPEDVQAIGILSELFPDREIIGLRAVDLIWGLGAYHCASMQQTA